MPKRVLDFDAMWGSDKLASCAAWAQAEYAWLYGLADASGCFELTNLRVIWGRVAAIRHNLTLERLEQIFREFEDKGLLFVWEENGKRYGHWSGSDVPGRLPPPSWRMRLERLAPPVPKQKFAEYMSRFARGRAGSPGGGFCVDAASASPGGASQATHDRNLKAGADKGLNLGLEPPQAQDWDWDKKQGKEEKYGREVQSGAVVSSPPQTDFLNRNSQSVNSTSLENSTAPRNISPEIGVSVPRPASTDNVTPAPPRNATHAVVGSHSVSGYSGRAASYSAGQPGQEWRDKARERELSVARELAVGRGPGSDASGGMVRVKAAALERIRAREAERERVRNGTRYP